MKRTRNDIPALRLKWISPRTRLRASRAAIRPVALGLVALAMAVASRAQSMPSAFENGFSIAAGGTASGYYIGYGGHTIAGPAVFVDIDTRHRLGLEGE